MNSPLALLRLFWTRSALLPWLLILMIITPTALLLFVMAHDPMIWIRGDATDASVVLGLLFLIVVLPGLAVGSVRLSLQHTTLGWMLPGVRRGLAVGTLVVVVPCALASALLVGRLFGWRAGAATFPLCLFWFGLPAAVIDGVLPAPARWAAALVLLASFAFIPLSSPARVGAILLEQPALVATVSLAGVATLLWTQLSTTLARRRPFRWSVVSGPVGRSLFWSGSRVSAKRWSENLQTDALGPWMRAAAHESMIHMRAVAVSELPSVLPLVLLAHALRDPTLLLFTFGMTPGVHLGRMFYPLSRSRRATLAFANALADASVKFALVALALLALAAAGVPSLSIVLETQPPLMWPAVGLGFALAPLTRWHAVRFAARRLKAPDDPGPRFLAISFGYCAVVYVGARLIVDQPPLVMLAIIVTAAVVMNVAFWSMLRRFFAHADLGYSV